MPGGTFDLVGALGSSFISGLFGDRADKRNADLTKQSERNKVYMMALQRQWDLADRRYKQDSFGGFARFAKKDYGPAGPRIDPNSIQPVDPFVNKSRGGVYGGTSIASTNQVAGSPNPSGGVGAPGGSPLQQTAPLPWRARA